MSVCGCSFMRPCSLRSGQRLTRLNCESLNALILEQRDLTFGKRMKSLEVWRIAKASKRLGRLAELCGVKCLYLPGDYPASSNVHHTVVPHNPNDQSNHSLSPYSDAPGYSWEQKSTAFNELGAYLAQFAQAQLGEPLNDLSNSSTSNDRRASMGERQPNEGYAQHGKSNSVRKPKKKRNVAQRSSCKTDSCSAQIHEQSLIAEALLVPLRHLSLRVYGDKEAQRKVASTACFGSQWNAILQGQLRSIVMSFAQLFEDLKRSRCACHHQYCIHYHCCIDYSASSLLHSSSLLSCPCQQDPAKQVQ